MTQQWFISDLHLSLDRPATLDRFESFLDRYPQPGDRLFILGDLFDLWVGDDDDDALAMRSRAALGAVTARGVSLYAQRGNRDIMLGRRLLRDCGGELLADCHVTEVAGQRTLLTHGDLLCTDDVDYQRARRIYRNPLVQWYLMRKSLDERRRIGAELKRRSGETKPLKAADIMDVNQATVIRYLQRYRVRQLVHGHTHRPAQHQHALPDGTTATRLVLPEWHSEGNVAWVDDGSSLHAENVD